MFDDVLALFKMKKTEAELFGLVIIVDRLAKKLIDKGIITKDELSEITDIINDDIENLKNYEDQIIQDEIERRKLI